MRRGFLLFLYLLLCSGISRRDSCSSSRASSNGRRRCSPLKGFFGSLPLGGEEYCGVGDPFGPNLHQQFGAHLVDGFIWPHDKTGGLQSK
jgi:hypothetical protein